MRDRKDNDTDTPGYAIIDTSSSYLQHRLENLDRLCLAIENLTMIIEKFSRTQDENPQARP